MYLYIEKDSILEVQYNCTSFVLYNILFFQFLAQCFMLHISVFSILSAMFYIAYFNFLVLDAKLYFNRGAIYIFCAC